MSSIQQKRSNRIAPFSFTGWAENSELLILGVLLEADAAVLSVASFEVLIICEWYLWNEAWKQKKRGASYACCCCWSLNLNVLCWWLGDVEMMWSSVKCYEWQLTGDTIVFISNCWYSLLLAGAGLFESCWKSLLKSPTKVHDNNGDISAEEEEWSSAVTVSVLNQSEAEVRALICVCWILNSFLSLTRLLIAHDLWLSIILWFGHDDVRERTRGLIACGVECVEFKFFCKELKGNMAKDEDTKFNLLLQLACCPTTRSTSSCWIGVSVGEESTPPDGVVQDDDYYFLLDDVFWWVISIIYFSFTGLRILWQHLPGSRR